MNDNRRCTFCLAPDATDTLHEEDQPPVPCCADEHACRARYEALEMPDALRCENCGSAGHDVDTCTRYLQCHACRSTFPMMHTDVNDGCPNCGRTSLAERDAKAPKPNACRCGQLNTGHQDRCPRCLAAERAPQGTQDALFAPAPAVMAGQTGMELATR